MRALVNEVVKAMDRLAASGGRDLNASDIHLIVHRRGEFQKRLRDCFYDIIDDWPDIKSNEARRFEVSVFLSRYRTFRLAARAAADYPVLLPPLGEALFRYVKYLDELDGDMAVILAEFAGTLFPRPVRQGLSGIARSLRYYVQEADDEFYERLILDRLTPSRPLKWRGTKVAATLFARHFGLTDSEMNRTFIFPGHGKTYRGLKMSSNVATKGDDRQGIAAILKEYPYLE